MSLAGLELAKKVLRTGVSAGGFDKLLDKVKILEAGDGKLVAEMVVDHGHCGQRKFMHGGMTALLVDSLSGVAMMTLTKGFEGGWQHGGVSLNINMTYLKAAKLGETILIKANSDRVGRKIAFLSVDILNKATDEVIAKGSHVKFIENARDGKDV